MGLIFKITRLAEFRYNTTCLVIFPIRSVVVTSRIVQRTLDWGRHRAWSFAPFTVLDVGNPSYWDALLQVFVEMMADRAACVAFPTEAAAEMRDERGSTRDDPGRDAMQIPFDEDFSNKAIAREKDLLDAMPLPGIPVDEAERRRIEGAYRHTADASTVWTPVFNCSGANFACCSGSSRVHSGVPTFSMRCLRR